MCVGQGGEWHNSGRQRCHTSTCALDYHRKWSNYCDLAICSFSLTVVKANKDNLSNHGCSSKHSYKIHLAIGVDRLRSRESIVE